MNRTSRTKPTPLKNAALVVTLLCIFAGACQQNASSPLPGHTDNPSAEALEPGSSNTSATASTSEQNNSADQEALPENETEACCEHDEPPNAVVNEVLPTAAGDGVPRINENTEIEEE